MIKRIKRPLTTQEQATLARLTGLRSKSCATLCHGHRGVCPGSTSTIFGNDCFATDIRSQVEVCKLVESLDDEGINVVGFGLSEDGITWTVEVTVTQSGINGCEVRDGDGNIVAWTQSRATALIIAGLLEAYFEQSKN